ncbi:uncharacterized protein [Musca autumnalis]|uniref:uncharacterized protein n=1 Tax=Musca autumnalis TaxID=221902 RepID=UPI003CE80B33
MGGGAFNTNYLCPVCNRPHAIRQCTAFLAMDSLQRSVVVVNKELCKNCLAQTHNRWQCPCPENCKRCGDFHHSLLHHPPVDHVWFAMSAMVRVYTCKGRRSQTSRAILDPNLKRSYITQDEAIDLHCIVDKDMRTVVPLRHFSDEQPPVRVECVVTNRQFGLSPSARIDKNFKVPSKLSEETWDADRWWFKPSPYQIILGEEACREIFVGPTVARPGNVFTQDSVFGQLYFDEGKKVPLHARLN